ncbi:glycosyltransferase [Tenacibaculum halocynthiae]|uniref:glycosyltransferase n=1 Tax=Tenacibaculum halocynthiae TaxID=1254437 RepID=UPI0038948403
MVFTVLFYIFVAVTVVQVIYFLCFSFFAFSKQKKITTSTNKPVSVIIYTKNNTDELKKNLPFIINQNYDDFEIVLINHASSDNSLDFMEKIQQENNTIKIVNVENKEAFWGNKKYALTLAIKAASNNHLLFFDINGKTVSNDWIHEMSKCLHSNKTIVIGHKKLAFKKYSFSNMFFRYANFFTTLKMFSYAKFGSPFKAYQNNFAYTKNDFFKVNGFINHIKIHLGESDLLLKDISNSINTNISTSYTSFVEEQSIITLKDYFVEQRKQTVLFSHYSLRNRFLLSFFNITKVIFYSLFIYFLIQKCLVTIPFIICYFLIQYIIIGKAINKLKEQNLLYFLPILDVCYVISLIFIFFTNRISKPIPWK